MRIAFQGEPGAYSEAAAIRFTDHADLLPCESFDDVFTAVATGKATHGILPVENSIGGSIHRNYDLLLEHDLPIVGEVQLDITHNLLVLPGTTLARSRRSTRTRRRWRSVSASCGACPACRSKRRTTQPAARSW